MAALPAFFRVYGQPHERLRSLPVSVLFRVGSAEKTNQEVRGGNRTLIAGSKVHEFVVSVKKAKLIADAYSDAMG